jgi:hypothetical protein
MKTIRDAYRQKLEARLEEPSARLALVRARARGMTADGRIATHEELAATEKQFKSLQARLPKLRTAGDDAAWRDLKGGVESAWTGLKRAQRAMKRFGAPGSPAS